MNRQKLEHIVHVIETLDFVRRWQVGQQEAVEREYRKYQDIHRSMVGHYYHFRENAFYEHGRQTGDSGNPTIPVPLQSLAELGLSADTQNPHDVVSTLKDAHTQNRDAVGNADIQSPLTRLTSPLFQNEADFYFKCKLCGLEIPEHKIEMEDGKK